MQSVRPRASRWFPGLVILALAGCGQPDADDLVSNADAPDDASFNLPVVALPDPPLDRADLLAAIASAASAKATGTDDGAAQRQLDGRQFEVRIRFGCSGPAPDLADQPLGWAFDAERRRLRVQARPTITADEPLLKGLTAVDFEAAEGFWIPRPWLLSASCPVAAAVKPETAGSNTGSQAQKKNRETKGASGIADSLPRGPRVGIAQFFSSMDTRTGRRGDRPYEAVKVLGDSRPLGSQGFNLVLAGRLRAKTGLGVIGCVAPGPDSPPSCVVSADFDKVWIERPDTKEIVAQWTSG